MVPALEPQRTQKKPLKTKRANKPQPPTRKNLLNLDLYEILPEEVSDEEASHLADIFMKLALAIESHYYAQIKRHFNAPSQEPAEPL